MLQIAYALLGLLAVYLVIGALAQLVCTLIGERERRGVCKSWRLCERGTWPQLRGQLSIASASYAAASRTKTVSVRGAIAGVGYPAYESVRALRTESKEDDTQVRAPLTSHERHE